MASSDLADSWLSSPGESLNGSFNIHTNEAIPDNVLPVLDSSTSSPSYSRNIPKPPPLPVKTSSRINNGPRFAECCIVPKETKDTWDKIFKDGYGADVLILTEDEAIIPAHSTVLSIASSVLGNFLQQAKVKTGITYIKIPGIPYEAVCMFIRFLYSSCFEEEEMKKFVLHLLVLSHSYSVPALKRVCIRFLDQGLLTIDNVIDVIQLARNCDAPQLTLICLRKIIKDFKTVSSTEGWKVMKRANPALEQELLESVVEADTRKQEKLSKSEERKIYLQLYEAMEALLHICRDGCRTIGPHDKVLRVSEASCPFPACKGVESLVRHFSNCKMRVPVGCVHCKRMWQLLELHSRMCNDSDSCRVPLCRHFKGKMQYQSKKDEAKWKLLVSKVTKARNALGPFVASRSRLL